MKKILITGADGFIGLHFCRFLKSYNHDIIELTYANGDIAAEQTLSGIDWTSISHVVHLSARTFVPESWEDPREYYRVNSFGTLNVLEYCRKHMINVLYISSYLYGHASMGPINEGAAIGAVNPYAHSKLIAENLCRFYSDAYKMSITVIRPFNVYGPGQKEYFLIPEIIAQTLRDPIIKVKDLNPSRDYVYITDLIKAMYLALQCNGYNVFNVGTGVSYSVRHIIQIVQELLNTDKAVIDAGERRKNEIDDVVADIGKIKKALNWQPEVSIKEGLQMLINAEKECFNEQVDNPD